MVKTAREALLPAGRLLSFRAGSSAASRSPNAAPRRFHPVSGRQGLPHPAARDCRYPWRLPHPVQARCADPDWLPVAGRPMGRDPDAGTAQASAAGPAQCAGAPCASADLCRVAGGEDLQPGVAGRQRMAAGGLVRLTGYQYGWPSSQLPRRRRPDLRGAHRGPRRAQAASCSAASAASVRCCSARKPSPAAPLFAQVPMEPSRPVSETLGPRRVNPTSS